MSGNVCHLEPRGDDTVANIKCFGNVELREDLHSNVVERSMVEERQVSQGI